QLRDLLRRFRDANRRKGTYVRYIYTLAQSPNDPRSLYFVLDAEENPENFSHTGDVYRYSGATIHLGEAYADSDFSVDKWGTWLSAYAPIRDNRHQVVAMLGIDISAESVRLALMPLQIAAAFSIGGALLLAMIGGVALA